ncbi:NB-ARC domain-containing protein [Phormidesmis sp. 146-33]
MTQEEALEKIKLALSPAILSELQIDIFRRTWNQQSYQKIARESNHEHSYIKDVGAELWKLLSQTLGTKVTKLNLQETLTQILQQRQIPHARRVHWGEAVDVSQFFGRQGELTTLEQWVTQERCRLIAIAGMGGMGKTMLVTQLAQQLADQFEIVVWRSLRHAPPLADFLTELLQTLVPEQPTRLNVALRPLLEKLRSSRCLLILDNIETVLASNEFVGTYRPGYEEYSELFRQLGKVQHQSCVLLTSREIPTEIAVHEGITAPIRLLRLKPLCAEAGQTILAAKGLEGLEQSMQKLIERYHGNPLMLEVIATPLKDLFGGDIEAFLAQETLLFNDISRLLKPQFDRLTLLERQVMYWLAIHREPMTAKQLQSNLLPSVSLVALQDALISLERRSLIEKAKPVLAEARYLQPLIVMEYVSGHSIEQNWQETEQAQTIDFRNHALLKLQANGKR